MSSPVASAASTGLRERGRASPTSGFGCHGPPAESLLVVPQGVHATPRSASTCYCSTDAVRQSSRSRAIVIAGGRLLAGQRTEQQRGLHPCLTPRSASQLNYRTENRD